MIRRLFLIYIFLYLANHLFGQASEGKPITIGETFSIYSESLGEERQFSVYLPPSHKDSSLSEKYPVLYVLDGEWYFNLCAGIVEYSKGSFKMPEIIIIGVANVDRIRDFTPSKSNQNMFGETINGLSNSGGGDHFISFLREELIPHIDSTYRAMNFRLLAGHSFGGLLANEIFTTDNQLFNAYLLIDPSLWWNNSMQLDKTNRFLDEHPAVKTTLFFGQADHKLKIESDNSPHLLAMDKYQALINDLPLPNVRYKHMQFENETHASVGLPSIYHGLAFMFEGYRPADSTFQNHLLLAEHYQKLSRQYGVRMPPPEGLVRNLGWGAQYGEKDLKKAILFFRMNVENYPSSANAHKVLGEVYEMDNQKEKALLSYRKSLGLNPQDFSVREKVENLMKE